MTCPHCHADTLDDARFCTHCGATLNASAPGVGDRSQTPGGVRPTAGKSAGRDANQDVGNRASADDEGPLVVQRRRRSEVPAADGLAKTDAVDVVTPPRPPQEDGTSTQVNPQIDPAGSQPPESPSAPTSPTGGTPTSVTPGIPAAPSAWDQPDGGAATAVHDLSSPEPPRAAAKPLPAPAPSSVWSQPAPLAAPRRVQPPSESGSTPGSGRWARVVAGVVSVWLPVSALIYVVLDQGKLLERSGLELVAIAAPTRLSWGVWSSTAAPLAWTVSLRALALLAGFGALVILAAWMARNRKAMQIGLIATGATVLTFGVVQLVWLIVGLDLITGLTVGQEIRQIYVPAGVSIAVGVLLACLAPVASRSKH